MPLKDLLLSSLPQYCETLPSEKQICFRPIIVSEEKALLLAKTTSDRIGILKTLENILINCCTDFKKTDFKKLKIHDLEVLFLSIRAKSIGEIETFSFKCPETGEIIKVSIDLIKDLNIIKTSNSNKIKLSENILIAFNEPTVENILTAPDYDLDENSFYKFVGSCLKQVHTKYDVKECKNLPEEELTDFVKSLTSEQLKQVVQYFNNITKTQIEKKYITEDQKERSLVIKGVFNYINFFFQHLNLETLYKMIFQLKYYHNYNLQEVDNMIPWERTIHVEQIKEKLQDEKNTKKMTENALYGR